MGHHSSKSYYRLQKRLDDHPQGLPASDSLFKLLKILFTEKEAELVSILPMRFFTAKDAAKLWKKPEKEVREILDTLADKGLIFDFHKGETQVYLIAPPIAGFFEMVLMRTEGKFFDDKVLSELLNEYINVEDDFVKRIFGLETSVVRTFIQEDTLQPEDKIIVLDYEQASHVIKTASCVSLSRCYCRHRMQEVGKACSNPQNVCLSLNRFAEHLVKHHHAKEISKGEAFGILRTCRDLGLVQLGDNVQEVVGFICNCCSCCCEALQAYKRLGYSFNISSNFFARTKQGTCTACAACVIRCPVDVRKLHEDKDGKVYADADPDRCIGCGVCARFCPNKSIVMERRKEINFTPRDAFDRYVMNAIETGRLQNFLFDNYMLWSQNLLRRFLGIILSLKPVKKLLVQRQLRSRFLEAFSKTKYYTLFGKLHNDGKPDYSHPELKK